jgi:hypothetical protein
LSKAKASPLAAVVPSAEEAKAVSHTRKEDIVRRRRPAAERTREEVKVPGRRQIIIALEGCWLGYVPSKEEGGWTEKVKGVCASHSRRRRNLVRR